MLKKGIIIATYAAQQRTYKWGMPGVGETTLHAGTWRLYGLNVYSAITSTIRTIKNLGRL